MELWGGHECTINRVGDAFFDQTVRSGHDQRLGDFARFADLGLATLRYPVLWDQVSPDGGAAPDFSRPDRALTEIRRLGLRVIAGLIHHGSGPRWTNLLDDEGFATGLAGHARAVAERHPWIDAYTPVNEPLTTARFSALYGHWYPHGADEGLMWRAVLNQIDATRLAMAQVRRVNSAARLVQTEDLGHTHASPGMAWLAEAHNHRRWVTWDLLCGRIVPGHPLHDAIAAHGLGDRLKAIADDPCPPDVIGVNHYVTSERFLDDDAQAYPAHVRSPAGDPPYVDVEAVRVSEPGVLGVEALLAATWERYGLPIAVTECHNGCTRDEQLRWVAETWRACERLNAEGCDVRAVTAWSLLGAYDWNSLLTRSDGVYEPGVFDLRGQDGPRPTAVAALYRDLAAGRAPTGVAATVLAGGGWWRRDVRFALGMRRSDLAPSGIAPRDPPPPGGAGDPFFILGGDTPLGRALAEACGHRDLPFVSTGALDDPAGFAARLHALGPCAVIDAAGTATAALAAACEAASVPFATILPDEDPASDDVPLCASTLVLRADLFSADLPEAFATQVLDALASGARFVAAEDRIVGPVHTPEFADAVLDLVIDGETGIWRPAHAFGLLSPAEFARRLAREAGFDPEAVDTRPTRRRRLAAAGDPTGAPVRRDMILPHVDGAIARFVQAWRDRASLDGRAERPGRLPLAA